MRATAGFRILSLQKQPRFLETFFVEIMQQIARGIFGQLRSKLVDAAEESQQVRLGLGIHIGHSSLQLEQRFKELPFGIGRIGHPCWIAQNGCETKTIGLP